jgi:polycomb protein EED
MTAFSPSPVPYTKLASFETPNCSTQFFMRFKLHKVPGQNHVLGFCNAGGSILFWDLKRLEVYNEVLSDINDPDRDRSKPLRLPTWLKQVVPRAKPDALNRFRNALSDNVSQISMQSGNSDKSSREGSEVKGQLSQETLESWAGKYSLADAATPLKAHKAESSNKNIVGRQTAWSPGGDWCVVVGSSNSLMVLQRWAK